MKRKISLVIAFALSFLLMFSPIATAEETKLPIQVCVSESAELEIVNKVPSAKMNKAVDSPIQEKTSDNILEGEKDINKTEKNIGKGRGPCGECHVNGDINVPGKKWWTVDYDSPSNSKYTCQAC
jgi:hypothetical protein